MTGGREGPRWGEIWKGKGEGVEGLVYYVAGRCCDCLAVISFSGGSDPLDWPLSSPTVPDPPPTPSLASRNVPTAMNSGIGGSER